MMECFFVYNNLKVSPFLPQDGPLPGFSLLTYDHESFTEFGSLWDMGDDSGFSLYGDSKVYGQIWVPTDLREIKTLERMFSVPNLRVPEKIKVQIKTTDGEINEKITAITYSLKKIEDTYIRVTDGKWLIKRK